VIVNKIMFVNDQDVKQSHYVLKIVNDKGFECSFNISSDCLAEKLKLMCLNHFGNNGDTEKLAAHYCLLNIRLSKKLDESSSLLSSGVTNNDELLLIKKKPLGAETLSKLIDKSETSDGPDYEDIERATADVEIRSATNPEGTAEGAVANSSVAVSANAISYSAIAFARELHPIFVSLVEHSQRLLCLSADAVKLFASVKAKLQEPGSADGQLGVAMDYPAAEDSMIRQLTDMGFQRARAEKALQLHHNVVSEAMDWLLVHADDAAVDTPLQGKAAEDVEEIQADEAATSTANHDVFVEPMTAQKTLDLFREYNRRQFKPIDRVKIRLMEMGFDEATAVDALRVCSNDESQALEYLLSDARVEALTELRGLAEDSDLLAALLADPVVQLGLTNPATLFAFLSVLDSPHFAAQWLNNSDVSPVLIQISRLYHAECCAKGVSVLKLKL